MVSSEYKKVTEYLSRMGRGDFSAFGDIYTMYEKRVYFLCCKITGKKRESEDLTRETFIYVYNNIGSISNPTVFDKWLYVAASNRCKIFLKRADPEKYSSYEDSDEIPSQNIEALLNADAETAAREVNTFKVTVDKMKATDRMIVSMPDKIRLAFMHYYFSGLSFEEIAQVEGISVNAVKNRLLKARELLTGQVETLCSQGLNLDGLVPAMTYMLETMSSSVIVPREISLAVSAQSGVTCISGESEAVINDPFLNKPPVSSAQPSRYTQTPAPGASYQNQKRAAETLVDDTADDEDDDDDYEDVRRVHSPEKMSPTVKILIGIICVLVVAIGVIAVVIFAGHKKEDTTNPDSVVTTAAETTTKKKETTTKEKETTTVAETTTKAPETTTKAPETTTKAPETTTQVSIRVNENNPGNENNNNNDNNNNDNNNNDVNNNDEPNVPADNEPGNLPAADDNINGAG